MHVSNIDVLDSMVENIGQHKNPFGYREHGIHCKRMLIEEVANSGDSLTIVHTNGVVPDVEYYSCNGTDYIGSGGDASPSPRHTVMVRQGLCYILYILYYITK